MFRLRFMPTARARLIFNMRPKYGVRVRLEYTQTAHPSPTARIPKRSPSQKIENLAGSYTAFGTGGDKLLGRFAAQMLYG